MRKTLCGKFVLELWVVSDAGQGGERAPFARVGLTWGLLVASQTEAFGAGVRRYRKGRGMLQRALAERVGLSASEFNRMEMGKRNPPPVEKILAMVAALRLTEEEAQRLVELAGYSSAVLGKQAAAGAIASALPAPGLLAEESPPTFAEQVAATIAAFRLPYGERRRAQRLVLEATGAICRVLREELERGTQHEQ